MEVNKYLNKIKLLLNNVSDGKTVIDENNMEKLLMFLEDDSDNSPGKLLVDSPSFSDLIFNSLENINNASTSLKALLIKILTILLKDELQFNKLQSQGLQTLNCKFCTQDNLSCITPSYFQLACIELAIVQITHCSGMKIIIENKVWKGMLCPKTHHKPKKVSDAVYKFMTKLVWKLNEYNNETVLMEVLDYILKPILTSEYLQVPVIDSEMDEIFADKIVSNLNALIAIFSEADNYEPYSKVISLLREYFLIDPILFELFNTSKIPCLLKLLTNFRLRYCFQFNRPLLYDKQTDDFYNRMTIFHRNYIVNIIERRQPYFIIEFVIQSNTLWSYFKAAHSKVLNFPLTFKRNGKDVEFSLQILVNLIMPMIKYSAMHRIKNNSEMTDVIEMFVSKLGSVVTDYMFTSCHIFGMMLEQGDPTFRKKVTIHALKELLRLKDHINESQAGILFQSLYYLVDMFIISDGTEDLVVNDILMDSDDSTLLTHLLNAINMLLKEHNIPWYENLEIVNVQGVLLDLLKQRFLTAKQVVQVLDLINICINKFLSPTMSLLVEDKCPNQIGAVMKLFSQHEDWEVRDSALNLLHSCTEISFIKYVPLRKVIRENSLFVYAVKAALTDPMYYSQTTALKCLAAATKIDSIWQDVLVVKEHIYLQLVHMLKNHGEGMVRKEIVNVLTGVYANQKIEQSFQNTLYEVMQMAAIDDLHWEVQLAALNFWKSAMQKELTYRGMLDGKFPSVTFSKEKRKIVILNDEEIRKQLSSIMKHLSNIGCLTVLLECMNELNDIDVMNRAYRMIKELVNILDKYKFEEVSEQVNIETIDISTEFKEENYDNDMPIDLSFSTKEKERNRVINDILNVDLSELLINLHDNYNQIKLEEMDIETDCYIQRKLVQPNKFLEHIRCNDYNKIIENKKKFSAHRLCTLNGLLDEMLDL